MRSSLRLVIATLAVVVPSITLSDPGPQARAETDDSRATPGDGDDEAASPASPAAAPAAAPPRGATLEQRDRWLADHIAGLIAERSELAGTRIGIHVVDAVTSRVLYGRDSAAPYSVASAAKIITTAAALALLGPDFRARTTVLAEQVDAGGVVPGDLYLRGRADPGLGRADLDRLADDLALAGITEVRGRLVIDDTYFDDVVVPPHFDEQPDENASFRAPVSALSPSFNAFAVVVRPATSGRGPAVVTVDPPGDHAVIEKNDLITQPRGRNRIRMQSTVEDGTASVILSGQLRADVGLRRFRQRVPDPLIYVGSLFRDALAARRIAIRGRRIVRGQTPEEATALAGIESLSMAILVRGLGKHSNNFVAEVLLKTIGAETRAEPGPATWQDGLDAVQTFLHERIGLERGSYRYGNGSGLFDATELSPDQLVGVLSASYRDPRYGPELMASLAIAGVDGTLRRRMEDGPAHGVVRAKTGTLARVSALAGYATSAGKPPLAFAVLVNDLPDEGRAGRHAKRQARDLQDRVAEALVLYLNADRDLAASP